jgi:hypothetical protein
MKARRFVFTLPSLAIALTAILAAEWFVPIDHASVQLALLPPPAIPQVLDNPADPEYAATIQSRPIFNPMRREAQLATVTVDAAPPHLAAVVVTGTVRDAFLATGTGQPQEFREGDRIGAYTLVSIQQDAVEVAGPRGAVALHLQYVSTSAAPLTTLAAIDPVAWPHVDTSEPSASTVQ